MARRILLVEDDEDLVDSLRAVLEEEGHQVTAARDGEAALGACDGQPELVLVDLHLGGALSGAPLIERLRERLGDGVRLILLSGDIEAGHRLRPFGADAFIEKPFAIEALLRAIEPGAAPAP